MFVRLAPGTTLRVARLEWRRTEGVERSCTADEAQQRYLKVEVAEAIAISEKDKTVGLQKLQGPSCTFTMCPVNVHALGTRSCRNP